MRWEWMLKGSPWESDEDDIWTGSSDDESWATPLEAFEAAEANSYVQRQLRFYRPDQVVYIVAHKLGSGDYVEYPMKGTNPYARDDDDDDWRRERAMQAGMGLGCAAYNDHMGY